MKPQTGARSFGAAWCKRRTKNLRSVLHQAAPKLLKQQRYGALGAASCQVMLYHNKRLGSGFRPSRMWHRKNRQKRGAQGKNTFKLIFACTHSSVERMCVCLQETSIEITVSKQCQIFETCAQTIWKLHVLSILFILSILSISSILSINLSISIYRSIDLSIYLYISIYLSIYLSISIYIYLYLSISI